MQAQEKKTYFSPQRGKWAIGVTFNPASIGSTIAIQPKNGEFAGDFLAGWAAEPKQMFVMSKDPMASIRFKYCPAGYAKFVLLINYSKGQ